MKTYIIAEMAWSHNGLIENAVKILKGAKNAGAQALGIHLTDLDCLMVKNYKCIAGQTLSDSKDNLASIFEYLNKINITNEDWLAFNEIAEKENMALIAMCSDVNSFTFSKQLNIRQYVISAPSFLEFDYIEKVVNFNSKIILRIGGATIQEIETVISFIYSINSHAEITLLAGIQLYPTPIKELHFKSILSLQSHFSKYKVRIGLADHIDGDDPNAIYLPGLALAFGVDCIEKHITCDRKDKAEDYEAALGIDQFKQFTNYIETVETALGDGTLDYFNNTASIKYREVVRKKIVASRIISKGETINKSDLTFKRSDFGATLNDINLLIGKKLRSNKMKDDGINLEDVK